MRRKGTPLAERFHGRYRKSDAPDGCWEWTSTLDGSGGYGQISLGGRGGKLARAHRVSYELHVGPIPDGLFVLHRCDNRKCVRPDHLFLGTHNDNMADCYAKGRYSHGARHVGSKLKEAGVLQILAELDRGEPEVEIAARHGISRSHVRSIDRAIVWRHLPAVRQRAPAVLGS